MPDETISASLSPEPLQDITAAIASLHANLPFLMSLTPHYRSTKF